MVIVRQLLESELAWANERYAEVRFRPSDTRDYVAVAEIAGERVGLGRLIPVNAEAAELGGIYVLPAFRGQQVARAIVAALVQYSPYKQLFCVPFAHLQAFYAGFGFHPVPVEMAVPCAVAEKVNWCAGEYAASIRLLVRSAG